MLELSTNLVRIQTKRCENSWGTLKQTLGNHPVYISGPSRTLARAALSWEVSYVLSPTELDLWEVRSLPQEREQDESQRLKCFLPCLSYSEVKIKPSFRELPFSWNHLRQHTDRSGSFSEGQRTNLTMVLWGAVKTTVQRPGMGQAKKSSTRYIPTRRYVLP